MPHRHWRKIQGLVHMMRVYKPKGGQFTQARRRAAENLKAYYIRMHPTPKNLSNENEKNFKASRQLKAWNWAVKAAMKQYISPPRASSSRTLGGGVAGTKSRSAKTNLRSRLLKNMKGRGSRGYTPTTRATR